MNKWCKFNLHIISPQIHFLNDFIQLRWICFKFFYKWFKPIVLKKVSYSFVILCHCIFWTIQNTSFTTLSLMNIKLDSDLVLICIFEVWNILSHSSKNLVWPVQLPRMTSVFMEGLVGAALTRPAGRSHISDWY